MPKVAIVGTTTWGTTLGVIMARHGLQVQLLARKKEEAQRLNSDRENVAALAEVSFPSRLSVTAEASEALEKANMLVLAVPAQTMRQNVRSISQYLEDDIPIVSAAKGLEVSSGKRMSQVIAEETRPHLHSHICVLSGPNLAREAIRGLPTLTVIAAHDPGVAEKAQRLLTAPRFCVLTNNDVVGVELGAALKNIVAIGAGMVDGLSYGDNTRAAFITRGLAEIASLGIVMGANPLTFVGLTGLGDLIATCSSPLSRNHYVGVELARGRSLSEITDSLSEVAEGVTTILAARKLAKQVGARIPITELIYRVLFESLDPAQAVIEMLEGGSRQESLLFVG